MLRFGILGVTYKKAGQELLARLASPPSEVFAEFKECVFLSTCNRIEFIFITDKPIALVRQRLSVALGLNHPRYLHAYAGEGAAEYLFCIASALDSMNPGDAQILGQLKTAYHKALPVGPYLTLLFEEAFQIAKRVRSETAIGKRRVSMLSLAIDRLKAHCILDTTLAIVGAGDMSRHCAELMQRQTQLLFVNRTLSKAQALAEQFGGQAMALSEFLAAPPKIRALVTATSALEPVFDDAFLRGLARDTLLIDLAIPRDIKPCDVGLEIIAIDDLQHTAALNKQALQTEIAEARVLIDEALVALRRRLLERSLGQALQTLRAYYANKLGEAEASLVNKITHLPTIGLKNLAFHHGYDAVEKFLAGMDAEFLTELKHSSWYTLLEDE